LNVCFLNPVGCSFDVSMRASLTMTVDQCSVEEQMEVEVYFRCQCNSGSKNLCNYHVRQAEMCKLDQLISKRVNRRRRVSEERVLKDAVQYIDLLHAKILEKLLNNGLQVQDVPVLNHIVRTHLKHYTVPEEIRHKLETLAGVVTQPGCSE
ncbi:Lysosomal-trafficking regulator, partial [Trichinella spiralis]